MLEWQANSAGVVHTFGDAVCAVGAGRAVGALGDVVFEWQANVHGAVDTFGGVVGAVGAVK